MAFGMHFQKDMAPLREFLYRLYITLFLDRIYYITSILLPMWNFKEIVLNLSNKRVQQKALLCTVKVCTEGRIASGNEI